MPRTELKSTASATSTPERSGPKQRLPAKDHQSFLQAHRWRLLTALVAIAGLAVLGIRWWLGPVVTTATILRRDLVQTVVASGHVEAPHRLDIGVQIMGVVLHVPVTEGQVVKSGDLLVELEAAELTASGREADVAVVQAQARLRQVQEVQGPVAAQALRQAQATLINSRTSLLRSQNLFAQGFVGQATLDEARKTAELADSAEKAARKQFDTTGPLGSDRALAMANVAGARANAQAARARTGYTVIMAPVAGTLIARNVEPGDVVQPGRVLMTLSPHGRTQLVVAIDEKNLALVAQGQPALASADAYPTERFAAKLAFINPGVNVNTGTVELKFDVAAPPATLKQDMTVSVDIEVARRNHALLVPLAAVNDTDGSAWVLSLQGSRAERRAIKLGLHSGGWGEVLGGLSEGDVILMGSAALRPGSRVRVAGGE